MTKALCPDRVDALCESLSLDVRRARMAAALAESLCVQSRHLNGITRTWTGLLQAAAVLHGAPEAAPFARVPRSARCGLSRAERDLLAAVLCAAAAGPPAAARRPADELALRLASLVRLVRPLCGGDGAAGLVFSDGGAAADLLAIGVQPAQAAACERAADLWNAVMARPIRSVRPAGGRPPEAALLSPRQSVAEAACRIFQRQTEHFLSRTYGLALSADIEFVHEMRVALRRLRSALRLFRWRVAGRAAPQGDHAEAALLPSRPQGGLPPGPREELEWLAAALGDVRDHDVFAAFLEGYARRAPASHAPFLRGMARSVRAARRARFRALVDAFRSARYQALEASLRALGEPSGRSAGGRTIRKEARAMLSRLLERIVTHDRPLASYSSDQQHALRIRFKRLRYAAEFLCDLYPGGLAELIEPALLLQDGLGAAHDAELHRRRVERYCARARAAVRDAAGRRAAAALLRHLAAGKRRAIRETEPVWQAFRRRKHLKKIEKLIDSPARR